MKFVQECQLKDIELIMFFQNFRPHLNFFCNSIINDRIQINFKMGLGQKVKQMVKTVDFFYSTEMLRYEDDLQYKTLTGGMISLGIIITIVVGFANMILNTLNLNTFTISTQVLKNPVPPLSVLEIKPESTFRLAVEVWRHNLSDTKRYFDVTFREIVQNYGRIINTTNIPFETCTKEYFKDYPQIVTNFDKLQSGFWLCPKLNTTLNIQGKYSSQIYKQHFLQVSACKNETDPSRPCASLAQIEQYFKENGNFFYFTVYFSNTQINPDKKDYIQRYIEDKTYTIFGRDIGSESYLYFSDYTVQTDQSIWPFTKTESISGCLAENLAINHPYETNINGTYVSFNIAKSSNSIVYSRQVQKLSAVFSFMGGMIGAVSAVLFIIKIYTSLSFEFSIAFEIFKKRRVEPQPLDDSSPESNDVAKKEKDDEEDHLTMNFFNFIRYYIYAFCDKIGCNFDWPQMDYANECKNEILSQLDIKLLLKRIIFIEHCLTYIIDDYQLDALQMKKPQTPKEIRQIRLKCESIVDRQLSSRDSYVDKSNQECKVRPEYIEPTSQMETANAMISNLEFIKLKNKMANEKVCQQIEPAKYQKDKEIHMQNDVIVMDIDSIRCSKKESQSYYNSPNGRNLIQNSYKRENTRKLYLMQLHANAEDGNMISNKIWKNLDQKIKKSVKNLSKQALK